MGYNYKLGCFTLIDVRNLEESRPIDFAFLDDRVPRSGAEIRAVDLDSYLGNEPSYVQEIESIPARDALYKCKFADGNGALYIRDVGAYASSIE